MGYSLVFAAFVAPYLFFIHNLIVFFVSFCHKSFIIIVEVNSKIMCCSFVYNRISYITIITKVTYVTATETLYIGDFDIVRIVSRIFVTV